jgi:dipeptidyl aminopeptidase/acylaminoacyl peptidase
MGQKQELSVVSQGKKKIDVFATKPKNMNKDTGLMLVIHGWGGNRYQYEDMMVDFCDRYNVICVSPEYRDSGFDAFTEGRGVRQPYDFSHLQLIDALTSLQEVRLRNPSVSDERTFVWGGSQGGQMALLAAEFAPNTFALIVNASGIVYPTDYWLNRAGWRIEGDEFKIRDARRFLENIKCKTIIFHGGKDKLVDIGLSYELEALLKKIGKEVEVHYFTEGGHQLKPVTTRMEATVNYASNDLLTRRLRGDNDFARKRMNRVLCTESIYIIDFSGEYPQIMKEKK